MCLNDFASMHVLALVQCTGLLDIVLLVFLYHSSLPLRPFCVHQRSPLTIPSNLFLNHLMVSA